MLAMIVFFNWPNLDNLEPTCDSIASMVCKVTLTPTECILHVIAMFFCRQEWVLLLVMTWLSRCRLFMYTRRMSRCSLVHVCEARVTMLALPVRFAIQQISNCPVAKPFASYSTWLGHHASTSKSQDSSNLEPLEQSRKSSTFVWSDSENKMWLNCLRRILHGWDIMLGPRSPRTEVT